MTLSSLFKLVAVLSAAGMVAACGTTSELKPTGEITPGSKRYSKVLVRNFESVVSDISVRSKVELAEKSFPDHITAEVRKTVAFSKVARGGRPDADTLVIDGTITEYEEGNAALRLMIGFGAGSSRFDAIVNFKDGGSGKSLGSVVVDKNSWLLGGALAASQDPDDFIPGAAKKVASEAAKFSRRAQR